MSTYLNRTFEFIPDRLNSDKWQARCRYIGLEPVLEALEAGRPIVFTFAHFGPYELFRSWMRAMGIPVAMLAGGNASSRSRLRLQKDRWAIFPNAKTAFHLNELPDAVRRFKTGQPLAMAFDVSRKRQTRVPLPDGWTFIMATGAIRLARKHGAQLFPCAIYNESPWRFTVEIAPAVPEKLLAQDEQITAKDILDKLLPIFEQHPDDWHPQLSGNFVPPPTD